MLRFGLVLLVATSAFAAPSSPVSPFEYVSVDLSENVGLAKDTGRANHLAEAFFGITDGGEKNFYTSSLEHTLVSAASKKSKNAQVIALGQAIAVLMAQATGIPGDVCLSADLIDKYTAGNYKKALHTWMTIMAKNLSALVTLRKNPQAARNAVGLVSGCKGGGRSYNFNAAWDAIIAKTPDVDTGILKEEYCAAKRLYNSFNVLNNNVAAAFTATSLPPVTHILKRVIEPLITFVIAIIKNKNTGPALSAFQTALLKHL